MKMNKCVCVKCESNRILTVSGKVSDMCFLMDKTTGKSHDGYVPDGLGIGNGDYIDFDYCLACGQIQDSFPKPLDAVQKAFFDEDADDD